MRERILLNKKLALPLTVPFKKRPRLRVSPPHAEVLEALAKETGVSRIAE
jgi:hypothetical protein